MTSQGAEGIKHTYSPAETVIRRHDNRAARVVLDDVSVLVTLQDLVCSSIVNNSNAQEKKRSRKICPYYQRLTFVLPQALKLGPECFSVIAFADAASSSHDDRLSTLLRGGDDVLQSVDLRIEGILAHLPLLCHGGELLYLLLAGLTQLIEAVLDPLRPAEVNPKLLDHAGDETVKVAREGLRNAVGHEDASHRLHHLLQGGTVPGTVGLPVGELTLGGETGAPDSSRLIVGSLVIKDRARLHQPASLHGDLSEVGGNRRLTLCSSAEADVARDSRQARNLVSRLLNGDLGERALQRALRRGWHGQRGHVGVYVGVLFGGGRLLRRLRGLDASAKGEPGAVAHDDRLRKKDVTGV